MSPPTPVPHRVTTLETAFRRYPDLPPEILVKSYRLFA